MPKNERKRTRSLSFRPGNTRITNSMFTYHTIENTARMYVKTIDDHRAYINSKLDCFYKRALNLPENIISDVYLKIKKIEEEMKMTMPEIAGEIKRVLGDVSFFRESGSPLPSENIHKAIQAIKANFPIKLVKQLLYATT